MENEMRWVYIVLSIDQTGCKRVEAFDDIKVAEKYRDMMKELLWKVTLFRKLLCEIEGKLL